MVESNRRCILATDPPLFTQFYDKLKNDPAWTVHTLPCSHFIQLEMPDECREFGFILFSTAQSGGLMTARLTALASMLITISMLAAPFLVRSGDRLTASRLLANSAASLGGAARSEPRPRPKYVSASRKELK